MSKVSAIAELYDNLILIASWGKKLYYLDMEAGEKSFNVNNGLQKSNENGIVENSQESILNEYRAELLNLYNVLEKIRSLKWKNTSVGFEKVPIGPELKELFFRYLDGSEKGDKLKIYINKIDKINTLDELFSNESREQFKWLFTEIFRLCSFTKLEPYHKEFEKIDFPFDEFEKSLDSIKNTLKNKCDLEIIIPNLFLEKIKNNSELYDVSNSASHILYADLVSMKDFEKKENNGVITDIKEIGMHSNKLGIDKKAIVYIYSSM